VSGASAFRLALRDLEKNLLETYIINSPTNSAEISLIAGKFYRWNMVALMGTNESAVSETRYFGISVIPVRPVILGVLPSRVPALDGPQGFMVNGNDFRHGFSVVLRDKRTGEHFEKVNVLFRGNSQFLMCPNFTKAEGDWTIEVINPGGIRSGEFPFVVWSPHRIAQRAWWASNQPWIYGGLAVLAVGVMSQRRRLARLHSRIHAQERDRLISDLHDRTSGDIAYLAQLSDRALHQCLALPSSIVGTVGEIAFAARNAEIAIGDLIWAAKPENENLRQLASKLRARIHERLHPKNIELVYKRWPAPVPEMAISGDFSSQVLYLCSEAINNVIKHSHATEFTCTLEVKNGSLLLGFGDNGKGFRTDEPAGNHQGLKNMRSRAQKLGGAMETQSSLGKGTLILISLPLKMGRFPPGPS
jgi:signal transduction histidine kinase